MIDEDDNEPKHISSALLQPITKQNVRFEGGAASNVLMVDTEESEMALRTLSQALLEIVKKGCRTSGCGLHISVRGSRCRLCSMASMIIH